MTNLIPLAMIICMIIIIVLLVYATIYLNIQFYKEKKIFRENCKAAEQSISDNTYKQSDQLEQIQLSEALDENLKSSKKTLSEDISGLNYELFDILAKNNLLKK